jgi:hypothetical protein
MVRGVDVAAVSEPLLPSAGEAPARVRVADAAAIAASMPPALACEVEERGGELEVPRVDPRRGEALRHVPDVRAQALRVLGNAMAEHGGLPCRRGEQAEQDPHQRGLARPVRPEASEHLAALDPEVDAVHGDERPEAPCEPVGLDDRYGGARHDAGSSTSRTSAGSPGRRSGGASGKATRAS